jgi:hypothetical protein
VEMGGEGEEELGGEREKAGWVGHGSGVVYCTSFTCYPLVMYSYLLQNSNKKWRWLMASSTLCHFNDWLIQGPSRSLHCVLDTICQAIRLVKRKFSDDPLNPIKSNEWCLNVWNQHPGRRDAKRFDDRST